jgi:hypothetical protein
MKAFTAAFLLVASLSFAQDTLPPHLRSEAARLQAVVNSVESYCRQIDTLTSEIQPTLLVADGVTPTSSWHQLPPNDRAHTGFSVPFALVWTRDSQVVAVKMWTPDLGKQFEPVSYCFRHDGGLARVVLTPKSSREGQQPRFRKTVAAGREWLFDPKGVKIEEGFSLQDKAPLKSETTYYIYPAVQFYKRVRDLPFLSFMSDEPNIPVARSAAANERVTTTAPPSRS